MKKNVNKLDVTTILHKGARIQEKNEICNAFNDHFASVGANTQESINCKPPLTKAMKYMKKVQKKFEFSRVSEDEVCRIVERMKAKTSSGYDGVSNMLLKKIIHVIKGPLTYLFNISMQSGCFPDLMKIAKVIPLFKSGNAEFLDNYRPISLLPVFSKILEKVVYIRFVRHLDSENILYMRQYGFRKGHSTSDAVFNLMGEILSAFNKGHMLLSIFIDLKKAFDTVSHELILSKLEMLGVHDLELQWFTSYLTNQSQFTMMNGVESNMKKANTGVPQGSLLGVVLFQVIINDMYKCLRYSTCILYADDTTIYVIGRSTSPENQGPIRPKQFVCVALHE